MSRVWPKRQKRNKQKHLKGAPGLLHGLLGALGWQEASPRVQVPCGLGSLRSWRAGAPLALPCTRALLLLAVSTPPPPRFWGLVVTSAVLSPGRVSFFTSGSENLHRVEKVHWGTRYAVTIAFTCNPDHGIADPALTPPGGPSAQPR